MSKTSPLRLAVVIVSYNVRDLLRACLASVMASAEASAGRLRVDVVVVDNASRDGSAGMVAQEFPSVHLLSSNENLGFTGGNNLALGRLGFGDDGGATPSAPLPTPDLVLLLNPDTEIVGSALAEMATFLEQTPTAGACGAHLRYGDGRFQHGAFRFPTLAQVFLDLLPWEEWRGVRRLLPRLLESPCNGRYPRRLWNGNEPFAVDFVLGAALMVRASVIRQVGLLDDGYFMYCEEIDWCLRMGRAGWKIYALPGARVVHHEGRSSGQDPWGGFERLWRSRLRFFHKHRERYPAGYRLMIAGILRVCLAWRERQARRRFALGAQAGDDLARELTAYRRILQAATTGEDRRAPLPRTPSVIP